MRIVSSGILSAGMGPDIITTATRVMSLLEGRNTTLIIMETIMSEYLTGLITWETIKGGVIHPTTPLPPST